MSSARQPRGSRRVARTAAHDSSALSFHHAGFEARKIVVDQIVKWNFRVEIMTRMAFERKWGNPDLQACSLQIAGDNQTAIGWLNGDCTIYDKEYTADGGKLQNLFSHLWHRSNIFPIGVDSDWGVHMIREFSKTAHAI